MSFCHEDFKKKIYKFLISKLQIGALFYQEKRNKNTFFKIFISKQNYYFYRIIKIEILNLKN